jgi:hypothetical protein
MCAFRDFTPPINALLRNWEIAPTFAQTPVTERRTSQDLARETVPFRREERAVGAPMISRAQFSWQIRCVQGGRRVRFAHQREGSP